MSAPLPAGPELDAAVARALGWIDVDECFTGEVTGRRPSGSTAATWYDRVPGFSTELGPHTQAMLGWLRGTGGLVQVQIDGNYEASWHDAGRKDVRTYGETLHLALARLVVAVAEAAKEAKP